MKTTNEKRESLKVRIEKIYKDEKRFTKYARHFVIILFLAIYIDAVYIHKTVRPTLDYNLGVILFAGIFIFFIKYVVKLLIKIYKSHN